MSRRQQMMLQAMLRKAWWMWDDLGGFAVVAESVDASAISDVADVVALDRLVGTAVGEASVRTLEALCASGSIHGAAALLTLHHHRTVAARIAAAEHVLGFRHDPTGQVRLVAALALRRLRSGAHLIGDARNPMPSSHDQTFTR
ncbi:hypothetical protein [Amycolatopsis thermoflava]|uniref:hypothetical protein n=1 Tax=Amycolatopsis thermoflava TaxID=84480 RepID=UPI0038206F2E